VTLEAIAVNIERRNFGTRGQILMAKCTKIDFGWGSVPDPLVGWGGDTPSPYPTPLGAYGPIFPERYCDSADSLL